MSYTRQYPFDRPISGPILKFADTNPPFVPQIGVADADMAQALPVICSAVANQAGARAPANPARMVHYNMLCANNWRNQEFEGAVMMVCDHIYMVVRHEGQFRAYWDAIDSSVEYVLKLACAEIAHSDREIMGMLSQEAVNDTFEGHQRFQYLVTQLQRIRAGGQPAPVAPGNSYGAGGYASGGNPNYSVQQGGGFPQSSHQAPAHRNVTGSSYMTHAVHAPSHAGVATTGSVLMQRHQPQPVKATAVTLASSVVARDAKRQAMRQAQQQQSRPTADPTYQAPEVLKWIPGPVQQYIPLPAGNETVHLDKAEHKGNIHNLYLIRNLSEEEKKMERAAHKIGTSKIAFASNVPTGSSRETAFSTSMAGIATGALAIASLPPDQVPEAIGNLTRYYGQKNVDNQRNLDFAIFTTRYFQKQELGAETAATAFRYDLTVAQPFISVGNFLPELQKLRLNRSIPALGHAMKTMLESADTPQELKDILAKLDAYLTRELNAVFRNLFSLPPNEFSISSLVDDAAEIFQALHAVGKGPFFSEPYVNYQQQFIDTHLYFGKVEEYETGEINRTTNTVTAVSEIGTGSDLSVVTDVFEKSDGLLEPVVHELETVVSITVVDMLAVELNMGTTDITLPMAIPETELPQLYNFAKATLDGAAEVATNREREQEGVPFYFAHHYIVTADDVIFELHKGLLGADFYLISRRST